MIEANGKKATPLCPCGFLGHYTGKCRCTPDQVALPQRLRMRAGLTQASGVRVVEVQPGGPAQAGLEPGDVIVGLDKDVVTGIDDIARVLDGTRIDKRVAVSVLRGGALTTVDVVPTERLP